MMVLVIAATEADCERLPPHFAPSARRHRISGKRPRTRTTADVQYPTGKRGLNAGSEASGPPAIGGDGFPARLGSGCRAENIRSLSCRRASDASSFQRSGAGPPLGLADENEASWRHDRR
jgi:hypothetical protein